MHACLRDPVESRRLQQVIVFLVKHSLKQISVFRDRLLNMALQWVKELHEFYNWADSISGELCFE